jgi:hypothetical protein
MDPEAKSSPSRLSTRAAVEIEKEQEERCQLPTTNIIATAKRSPATITANTTVTAAKTSVTALSSITLMRTATAIAT